MTVLAVGLDYSDRRLTGAQIRAAGYSFVVRYLWFPGQGHAYLTATETADLLAGGVEVHAVYEEGTGDPAGGYAAGARMARQALASARTANLPAGQTIFFCADAWLSTHGISVPTAMSFLDGARSVIGPSEYELGAYGFADFIFAAQTGGHADRLWLCGTEIPDDHRPSWLHLYQSNQGYVYVSGLQCDLNKKYVPLTGGAVSDESEDDVFVIERMLEPSAAPAWAIMQCPAVGMSEPLPSGKSGAYFRYMVPNTAAEVWALYLIFGPAGQERFELIAGPGEIPTAEGGVKVEPAILAPDKYTIYKLPVGCTGVTLVYSSKRPISIMIDGVKEERISKAEQG